MVGQPRGARDLLLCLSHLRWDFVFQRPQHLLTRAAATYDIIFFEEPIYDVAEARLDRRPVADGIEVCTPHLPPGTPEAARDAKRAMLDGMLNARAAPARILWFYTPMALDFADGVAADVVVYDCMDELSAFRDAPPRLLDLERRLLARADLVFTGGRSLFEAKRDRHPRVFCFPSSIDAGHFARAREPGDDPADQAAIARPRIGFFGVVDERMDLGLVAALAARRPDWQFVMIGPVVKIDPASVPRAGNLHWLGGKPYAALPDYLRGWQAGFMPFALNESTRYISPTKTPEFLAAGLPLVSTPVVDVVSGWGDAGLVAIANDAEAMAASLDELLTGASTEWLERVDGRLGQESWDTTWQAMRAAIATRSRNGTESGSVEHV